MSCDGTGIYNGRDIPTGITVCADVGVIGSGPAGVSAAWKLAEAGLKVILLDGSRQLHYPPAGSTDQDYYQKSWPDKKKLYSGVATGIFAATEPDFLTLPTQTFPQQPWERERVFGGTPVHGGGQCRPQDPIDIEGREPAFPRWPITYDELHGFYMEASAANHLTGDYPENFTAEFWERKLELTNAILKLPCFDAEMYQFMGAPPKGRWKNFATRPWGASQRTIEHFVQVIVNATVLNIAVQGGKVDHLEVASMEDDYPDNPMHPLNPKKATEFKVKADIYILACGAVENARQLLLSRIGDKNMVGHYFMCHPLSRESIISTTKCYLSEAQYRLMQGSSWSDPVLGNTIEGRFITNPQITKAKGIGRCWFWANHPTGASQMYFEMAPNYESHVTLDPDDHIGDPVFGQQRPKIHWCLDHTTDKRTYEKNCEEFNLNIKELGGEISYPSWEETFKQEQWIVNGHHMGTTRMSVKPEEGVVDENLKVHGVGNLYVAGSSVFPSGGISNPTFTIVALSLRLAAHVQKRLGRSC